MANDAPYIYLVLETHTYSPVFAASKRHVAINYMELGNHELIRLRNGSSMQTYSYRYTDEEIEKLKGAFGK